MTDEFTAAPVPDPDAPGTGETSFADADAPPAAERAAAPGQDGEAGTSDTGAAAGAAGSGAAEAPAADGPAPAGDAAADGPSTPEGGDAPVAPGEAAGAPVPEAPDYLALAQRTQADFENYRRRMTREVAQSADRGMARLAKELLPALDHLELSLKAATDHEGSGGGGSEDLVKGFAMVREELMAALNRVGIQPFSPEGEPFDPNEHEALASHPSEGAEPGTVVQVYQQGYRINGAVLRPARVVVAQ